jgi:putative DNA primase/helicase
MILENIVAILSQDSRWAGRIQLDEFSGRTCLDGRPIADADEAAVALWLSRAYSMVAGSALVGEGMRLVGREFAVHPVRDYLDRLRWDGVARLDTWLSVYLGAEADPLVRAIGRAWAISAVARANQPGCKVDTVLILQGGQGAGKSTAIKVLGGQWSSDTPIVLGNKDVYEQITGVWLYELAELDSFRKADWAQIKALITSPSDNVRRAYARNAVDVPRQGVFVGTTNADDFLADSTGSRRFWPVTVGGSIDLEALRRDRDQLWAEAMEAYTRREPWWLNREQDAELAKRAERYEQIDPWTERVAAYAKDRVAISMADLLEHLDRPAAAQSPHDGHRAGSILRNMGWVRERETRSGARIAVWVKRR